ncbi:MAG: hypothetical protein LBK64_08450 [Spirochaetaceae bacterium]|nr:hypothetical protein [Spirochaetaceae bacterium]
MKKAGRSILLAFAAVWMLFPGCASGPAPEEDAADSAQVRSPEGPYYIKGEGAEGLTLAVVLPEGKPAGSVDTKYLEIIQGVLTDDFSKCSGMTLIDRQNLERVLELQRESASGDFSDDDYIAMGKLTNAKYSIFGALTALGNGAYLFQLSITNNETAVVQAAYTAANLTLNNIQNLSAIRAASAELLPQLGVTLTNAGRHYLTSSALESEIEAQNNLAMSLEAARNGDFIASLIYSYSAEEADAASASAQDMRDAALAQVVGAAGAALRKDYENQQLWKKNLEEFEKFYEDHPPYTLLYTPIPKEGATDYDNRTVPYEFTVSLRATGVSVMQKVLNDVDNGLDRTKMRNKWGFGDWPEISAQSTRQNQIRTKIFEGYSTYTIRAALCNDKNELVAETEFEMYGQMAISGSKIRVDSTQDRKMLIPNADVNKLTDNMVVKIISINDRDVEESNLVNYIVSRPVRSMPWLKISSLSARLNTMPELPEEREARMAQEQEEARERERKEMARREKQEKYRDGQFLKYRVGLAGAGHFNPADFGAASFQASLEAGFKALHIEGFYGLPFKSAVYEDPILPNPGSVRAYGGGIGLSKTFSRAVLTIGGGYTRADVFENHLNIPYAQLKVDILPWYWGPGFRIGYQLEGCIYPKSELEEKLHENSGNYRLYRAYDRYFDGAFNIEDVLINGRIMAGVVFWL